MKIRKVFLVLFVAIVLSTTAFSLSGDIKWKKDLEGGVLYSCAVNAKNNIYVGTSKGYLYSLDSKGATNWKIKLGKTVKSEPVISDKGIIYIASSKSINAIDSDGSIRWRYEIVNNDHKINMSVGNDGTVYFISDLHLYALNPDGSEKWEKRVDYRNNSHKPIIIKNNLIYCTCLSGVKAIDTDGNIKWTYNVSGGNNISSIITNKKGDLYFGCNKYLYKISKNGKLIWKYKFDEHIENIVSPILGSNGEVYLPVQSKLAAISNEGKLLWKKNSFRMSTLCSPVLDNRENIYLMNSSGFLYSLKCSGRKNWEIHFSGVEFGNEVKNSILNIGRKGALYFGTKDGAFIAVETGSTGLGQTDWPVYGRNCQNTSSIIE